MKKNNIRRIVIAMTFLTFLAIGTTNAPLFGQQIPGRVFVEEGETHRWNAEYSSEFDLPIPGVSVVPKLIGQMDYTAELTIGSVGEDTIAAYYVAKNAHGFARIDTSGKPMLKQMLNAFEMNQDTVLMSMLPDGEVVATQPKREGQARQAKKLFTDQILKFSSLTFSFSLNLPPEELKPDEPFYLIDSTTVSESELDTMTVSYVEYTFKGIRDTLGKQLGLYYVRNDGSIDYISDPETDKLVRADETSNVSGVSRIWFDLNKGLPHYMNIELEVKTAIDPSKNPRNIRQQNTASIN